MASFPDITDRGDFLIIDPLANIDQVNVNSREFKEKMRELQRTLFEISQAINRRDAGFYSETEFITGQLFFPDPNLSSQTSKSPVLRQGFRILIDCGALPNATSKSIAHGLDITSQWSFTRIYGTATDTATQNAIPIPYAHPTSSNNIALDVDGTNVQITTGSDRTAFDTCFVILEYIKE